MNKTEKIDFNNYTDFEKFLLESVEIVNTVATAALKIENLDDLGKNFFLDLKYIIENISLDLKNIGDNKNKLFIRGSKYNQEFRSLQLYSETTNATIFRNGKMIFKTKLKDDKELRKEAIKFATLINQKCRFIDKRENVVEKKKLKFKDFTVVNVVGSANVMFNVDLIKMSDSYKNEGYITYEPEKFSGLLFNCFKPKVTIIIFRTAKLIVVGETTNTDFETAFKNI